MKILLVSAHAIWDNEFAATGHEIVRLLQGIRVNIEDDFRPINKNMTTDDFNNYHKYADNVDIIVMCHPSQHKLFKDYKTRKILHSHAAQDSIQLKDKLDDVNAVTHICNYSKEIAQIPDLFPQFVIHNGVKIEYYDQYDVDKTDKTVIASCLGMLKRYQDFNVDIWGYELFKDISNEFPTVLIGGGNMKITGYNLMLPMKKMTETMVKSRVFFNHTKDSLLPSVILDAMACGMPIVSTVNDGIPDALVHGENALLSNDPKQLKEYIRLLLNDKDECTRLGRNARKTAEEHFNTERMAREWNEVLNFVMSDKIR